MKKALLIIIILFLFSNIFCSEKKIQLIKRTVLIFPFINNNKVEKYDYLKDTLLNALNSELIRSDQFNFIPPTKLDSILEKENKNIDYYEKTNNSISIALKLNADVIVIGQYIIIEDKIMIQIKAIDVFSEQIAASTTLNGELGVDIFRIIEESSKDIAIKMAVEFKMADKTYFKEMSKALKNKKYLEYRSSITTINKVGIIFLAIGGSLFILGLPAFISDLSEYASGLQYIKKGFSSNDYNIAYQIFIGLLSGSIVISAIGLTMLIIGIPLLVYKKKEKISFNMSLNYNKMEMFVGFKL